MAAMKAGVKAGHLRHVGHALEDGFDGSEIVGLMKWRQWDQRPQLLEDFLIDNGRPVELWPAMHYAVTDTQDACAAVFRSEPGSQRADRLSAVTYGLFIKVVVDQL